MGLTLEWTDETGTLQVLDFDAVEREGHEESAELSEHAVETGAAIGDHVRPGNGSVTLTAWVSDTPLEQPRYGMQGAQLAATSVALPGGQAAQVMTATGRIERVRRVDEALRDLLATGQVLTARPTWRAAIGPCVLTRYAAERTAETGAALPATLELKRVRLASTDRAPVPRVRRAQRQREARGAQPAAPAPVPEDRRSTLVRLLDLATGRP